MAHAAPLSKNTSLAAGLATCFCSQHGRSAGSCAVLDLARILLAVEILMYALVLAAGAIPAARRHGDPGLALVIPIAIATMHFSWGSGFLFSMLTTARSKS